MKEKLEFLFLMIFYLFSKFLELGSHHSQEGFYCDFTVFFPQEIL